MNSQARIMFRSTFNITAIRYPRMIMVEARAVSASEGSPRSGHISRKQRLQMSVTLEKNKTLPIVPML